MKFCPACGGKIVLTIPESDDRQRYVCTTCATVHYQNPDIVTGCIPEWDEQILLCKRAIEPRSGYWTLPAGFLEIGETVMEGATRETLEEANARVEILSLYTLLDIPRAAQVFTIFRARLLSAEFSPGAESLEVKLFSEEDIPWDALAFSTVKYTLECFFADRREGSYKLHMQRIG